MKIENTQVNMNDLVQAIQNAPKDEKGAVIVEAMQQIASSRETAIVEQYREAAAEVNADAASFSKYGLRHLSKEEKDFYEKVTNPNQLAGTFTNGKQEDLIPTTITNYIFEDLKQTRPLFAHIDWSPAGVKKWILGEHTGKATWGTLDAKVVDEIKSTLTLIDFEAHKLSAFSFIPKGIIDLGYAWVDRYVREVLLEVNDEGLEAGIISGDGKNSPVGLNRLLTGAVDGVHKERTAKKVIDFSAASLGEHLATLSNDGKRKFKKVIMIVNSLDYFSKVMPASMFLTAIGEYRQVLPFDIEIIPSTEVKSNQAILYVPNGYTAGVSKMGISFSDEYEFLDDTRTYKIVTYGNGRLKAENMAELLDISEVKPLAFNINPGVDTTPEV